MAADGESVDALYDRLQNLEAAYEQQREELRELKAERVDEGTVGVFEGMGLTRRQALLAAGYVAAGMTLGGAATKVLTDPAAAQAVGEIGTSAEPISKAYIDDLAIGANDFVATGDTFPVAAFGAATTQDKSISQTSFSGESGLMTFQLQWDKVLPANASSQIILYIRYVRDGSETVTSKLRNITDGEDATSDLARTADGNFTTGWEDYTPATTGSPILFQLQAKTSANSPRLIKPTVMIGIKV